MVLTFTTTTWKLETGQSRGPIDLWDHLCVNQMIICDKFHPYHSRHRQIVPTPLDLRLVSAIVTVPVTGALWLPYQPHTELESGSPLQAEADSDTLRHNSATLITLQPLAACLSEWFGHRFLCEPRVAPLQILVRVIFSSAQSHISSPAPVLLLSLHGRGRSV